MKKENTATLQKDTTFTLKETMAQLKALGDAKRRKHNTKYGAGDNQFGVPMGNIRKMAKKIKTNHELALELWATENVDARFLAILIIELKNLSVDEMEQMVRSVKFVHVADWLNSYVVKLHLDNEILRQKWMAITNTKKLSNAMAARAGWNLTNILVKKNPDTLDLTALLNRIEAEMGKAAPEAQWTMNFVLVETGIRFPEHRERALAIGETLGIYSDFPVSKGCTSPFAPIWIETMVARQK